MTPEQQAEILGSGTEEIIPRSELLARLEQSAREKRPLRVKQGFDPTAPDIHLGHTVGLRKLRRFQELGHQVVLIVGDYTGMVGDPSGRTKTRPQLTSEQVDDNARTYLEQFFRVLEQDPRPPLLPVEVHRNGEWFARMPFMEVLRLAAQYTVARLLERDDFSKRMAAQHPIGVHELFYPLMQGYDSVAIRADLELGGTDQKFNLLVGRTLQEAYGQQPQIVMTVPLLPGIDGVQRMGKSLGNYVGVTDAPDDMYGKVMSVPDSIMPLYWGLVADRTKEESREIEADLGLPEGRLERPVASISAPVGDSRGDGTRLETGPPRVNPMLVKKRLAHRLVTMYHGAEAAERAQAGFEAQFSRRETPRDVEVFGRRKLEEATAEGKAPTIVDFLVASGISSTRSAARRLIDQNAVDLDQEVVKGWLLSVDPEKVHIIRGGRQMRKYVPDEGRS